MNEVMRIPSTWRGHWCPERLLSPLLPVCGPCTLRFRLSCSQIRGWIVTANEPSCNTVQILWLGLYQPFGLTCLSALPSYSSPVLHCTCYCGRPLHPFYGMRFCVNKSVLKVHWALFPNGEFLVYVNLKNGATVSHSCWLAIKYLFGS